MAKLMISKIKAFRPTVVSVLLLVFASIRMFMGGNSVWLVGVCAGVVPFICQFKRYPLWPKGVSEKNNVLANYFVNILYALIYLSWILLVTGIGKMVGPGYECNDAFVVQLLLAICTDMIFIACVYTVGHKLSMGQRLGLGILLCNGQLGFMLFVYFNSFSLDANVLILASLVFICLIFALTLGFIILSYRNHDH